MTGTKRDILLSVIYTMLRYGKSITALLLIVAALTSCREQPASGRVDRGDSLGTITGKDSLEMGVTRTNRIDSSFAGFFQSPVPCSTCDGSQQTLLLLADGSYRLEDRLFDSTRSVKSYRGSWANQDERLMLFEGDAIIAKFIIQNKSLKTIERQGIPFSDSVAREHILSRREWIMDNPGWSNKKDQGVEVYGIGTEPFWSVSIGQEPGIIFTQIDQQPIFFPYTAAEQKGDTLVYNTISGTDSLLVRIDPAFCSDGMSDFLYAYTLSVRFKGQQYRGCGSVFIKP